MDSDPQDQEVDKGSSSSSVSSSLPPPDSSSSSDAADKGLFQLSDQDRADLGRRYGTNTSGTATATATATETATASVNASSSVRSVRTSTGTGMGNKPLSSMVMQTKSNSNFNPSFEPSDYAPNTVNSSTNDHFNINSESSFQKLVPENKKPQSLSSFSSINSSNNNANSSSGGVVGPIRSSGRTTPLSLLAATSSESEMMSESIACSVSDVSSIFGPTSNNSSNNNSNNNISMNNNTRHSLGSYNFSNESSNNQKSTQLELENSQLKISIKELIRENEKEVSSIHEKHNIQCDSLKKELRLVSEKLIRVERMGSSSDGDKSHEIEILSNQLAATEIDRDVFDKKSERLRIELDEKKSELNRVKMEYSRLRVESDGNTEVYKDQIRALELRYNKAITDNQEKIFSKDNEILKLEEQNRVTRSELMDKNQSINHLSEDYGNLERRCQQADSDNNALRRKVAGLEQLESDLTQARRRNQVLEVQLESQTSEMARLSSQCQQLQLQVQQYQLQQSSGVGSGNGNNNMNSSSSSSNYISRNSYSNFNPNMYNSSSNSNNTNVSMSANNLNSFAISSGSSNAVPPNPPPSMSISSSSGNINDSQSFPLSNSSSSSSSSKPVNLNEWKSLGYPSEFAMAKDKGILDIKPSASAASLQQQQPQLQQQNYNSNNSNDISNSKPRLSLGRKSLGASIGGASMGSIISQLNSSNNTSQPEGPIPAVSAAATVSSRGGPLYNAQSPFATETSSLEISKDFDMLDKKLTDLINEKKTLREESDRLFQRGTKTLKEKSRLTFIDGRVEELNKEISGTRRQLSSKPV